MCEHGLQSQCETIALAEAPQAYETFQKKEDGVFKVVFKP
jgi:threonine dehydrogenase-like Zn-dependent dehydrogenase